MKISYNWLCSYLPTELSTTPEEIAELLTDSGLEVEGLEKIESVKGGLAGLVIGEVLEKTKHPDADKLSVTRVDVGQPESLQIVCGAANVAAGQKVVVALVGATLYPSVGEPFTIKKSKIRGVESHGMICAEDEIGLGQDHSGIMVLDPKATVGSEAKQYFELEDDYLLELNLTPNRADAMSHFGVARDLLAVYNIRKGTAYRLRKGTTYRLRKGTEYGLYRGENMPLAVGIKSGPIEVQVADTERCPRYAGIYISQVQVKPSPEWLQKRLRTIGVRPINNIV
ncbi:MAG TPA: phenylalanine--tRNA ligase beta subunit-related protein, partial [Luteibaculaceae bacterium]|nr:phenylalanine--tRNA ligase beta subunit-related protein [Luteibaculaceae bacterium]